MSNSKDSLGDRIKQYEEASKTILPRRMPVIIRVDGKAFHTYTKGCKRPFDENLNEAMIDTAIKLCKEIQGAQIAYIQSDEISIFVHSYKTLESQPWFGNQVQKMCSISAAVASATFTYSSQKIFGDVKPAYFDSRVFVIPESDVCNYFIWRQQDTIRNSIQMFARLMFSSKQLHGKNCNEILAMCKKSNNDWCEIDMRWKHGVCVFKQEVSNESGTTRMKWSPDYLTPEFIHDRDYINKFVYDE